MALYGTYTDKQLIISLRNGEADAFTEIYERYWNKLLVYTMRVIRQQPDAEDIVQELFVSIWRRRDVQRVARVRAGAGHSVGSYRRVRATGACLERVEND